MPYNMDEQKKSISVAFLGTNSDLYQSAEDNTRKRIFECLRLWFCESNIVNGWRWSKGHDENNDLKNRKRKKLNTWVQGIDTHYEWAV
jgi:hypothetical protein